MKVAVTGSTGLVGRSLVGLLRAKGDVVVRLVRHGDPAADEVTWDAVTGAVNENHLAGVDAIVHLAGENIATRWSGKVKTAIRDSRVKGTDAIARIAARLPRKPDVLVCASAIGLYGDRGDEVLDEDAAPGKGFLPDVCSAWEAAAAPARDAGIRVVHVRIGVVLSPLGGALEKMLPPFKLGLGGPIGNGRQWLSWISIGDVCGALRHAVVTPSLAGPVNAVAPNPATNRDFAKTLGKVLHRPALAPLPGFVAKLALGQMAEDLLLASTRVAPKKLQASGFRFEHPQLEAALTHVLAR